MKNKIQFGWKDIGELWWMFVALLMLCGVTLIIINRMPHRCPDNEAYDVETRKCVKVKPEETTVIYPNGLDATIRIECSKEIEKAACPEGADDGCVPECRDDVCKKKAETTETAIEDKAEPIILPVVLEDNPVIEDKVEPVKTGPTYNFGPKNRRGR